MKKPILISLLSIILTSFTGCLKNAEPGGIRSHGGYKVGANKYVD